MKTHAPDAAHAAPWNRTNDWPSVVSCLKSSGLANAARTLPVVRGEVANEVQKSAGKRDDADIDDEEDIGLQRARVEALLLVAKIPLPPRKLAALAQLPDATRARTMVNELNELYDALGRGLRIESIAGGYRMLTRPVVAPWLGRLGFLPSVVRLSWPMMETLAVVAYRQDVTRADVEAVRGVACGEILRQLMQLELVRISGRSEELGRPYLYGTTKRFLKICGLPSINALPPIDWRNIGEHLADSKVSPSLSPRHESSPSPDSSVPKESDVSVVLSESLAPLSLVARMGDSLNQDGAVATLELETASTGPRAAIEDEEDDLYEGDDDDADDDDDDWADDDEDEDDEVADEEEEDDDEDDADDEEEVEADDDEEEEDADWEEVDDDDADEDWEEDDDDDDDWDEDDDDE